MFSVTQVDVIVNPVLEERFKKAEVELAKKINDRNGKHQTLQEKWKSATSLQRRSMDTLNDSIFWCTDDENIGTNPVQIFLLLNLLT
jgi:hypothetical protein